jgi:ribosome-associated toxin RatA of RatAB toxin-antitoxin module
MARIQQSIEIGVPARVAYNQLTQFEDYPRFMDEVESAEQVDDTHVRWTTKIGQHARDWQSEIVEQKPDQCIEWRNVEGPVSTGRVEVEALGTDSTRVTFTVESEATSAGEAADAMARQVGDNLQRLKQLIESGGETGAWRGEVHDGKVEERAGSATGEVNADQQSETVRRTGKLPQQSAEGYGDVRTSEAMQNALQPDARQTDKEAGLDQAIKRAVPPSN